MLNENIILDVWASMGLNYEQTSFVKNYIFSRKYNTPFPSYGEENCA